jgi:hypothetical protein
MTQPIKVTIDTKDLEKKVDKMIEALKLLKSAFQDVEEKIKPLITFQGSTWAEFNLNNYIKFKLTEKGEELLKEYCKSHRVKGLAINDSDGFVAMQAWEAFNIFGKHFHIGEAVMETTIYFEVKN